MLISEGTIEKIKLGGRIIKKFGPPTIKIVLAAAAIAKGIDEMINEDRLIDITAENQYDDIFGKEEEV